MIAISIDPIDVAAALKSIESERAGAIDLFLGVVRATTQKRSVNRLEYESYDRMAISEMEKIVTEASQRWPILRYTVIHRKGTLQIGEIAVLIGVATAHRGDAFDACQYIIDTIKQTVPIWKKEVFRDGEEWVNAHP